MNITEEHIKNRDNSIDLIKGVLIILMIIAHIIQLIITEEANKILEYISIYVNLTTFSGFLFCNGYVWYIAYLRKEKSLINQKI